MTAVPGDDRRGGGDRTTSARGLVVGLLLGLPVLAYGVRGVLIDAGDTHPAELARWMIGVALAGDLVLVPLALAAGALGRRFVPVWAWPAVRAGLLATGVLALVGWPFVRGYGTNRTVPSLLARNYATGLAIAVALAWFVVAVLVAWQRGRARSSGRGSG
jgi:hypothetical protein